VQGLLQAPYGEAEVVGLVALIVLPVGDLVVGVEPVDHVDLREG
jgi:hypothetical protein